MVIQAGSLSNTITVTTDDDEVSENTGRINVKLTPTTSYAIARPWNVSTAQASITVKDNDPPPKHVSVELQQVACELRMFGEAPRCGLPLTEC